MIFSPSAISQYLPPRAPFCPFALLSSIFLCLYLFSFQFIALFLFSFTQISSYIKTHCPTFFLRSVSLPSFKATPYYPLFLPFFISIPPPMSSTSISIFSGSFPRRTKHDQKYKQDERNILKSNFYVYTV
jgi:hypothetical protein